jgi:hypothetical protein
MISYQAYNNWLKLQTTGSVQSVIRILQRTTSCKLRANVQVMIYRDNEIRDVSHEVRNIRYKIALTPRDDIMVKHLDRCMIVGCRPPHFCIDRAQRFRLITKKTFCEIWNKTKQKGFFSSEFHWVSKIFENMRNSVLYDFVKYIANKK